MKKIIIATAICGFGNHAFAAFNCCENVCPALVGGTSPSYDSSCTNSSICNCSGTTETTLSGGVIEINTKKKSTKCENNTAYAECANIISYKCAVGYYGTPGPLNKTCTRCPSSGGVYGTTATSGATSITECYLAVGTTGSDSSGSFTYTSDCYYSN